MPASNSDMIWGVPVFTWLMAGLLGALFVATYWTNLRRLWWKTNPFNGVDEWAHAVFVPIVGIMYLFLHLDELLKTPVKPLLGITFTKKRFISAGATAIAGAACYFAGPMIGSLIGEMGGGIIQFGGIGLMVLAGMVVVLDWGIGTLLLGLAISVYGISPGKNDFLKDVGMVVALFGAVLTIGGWGIMRIAWFPIAFLLCALPWPGLFYSYVATPMQLLAAHVGVGVMQVCGVEAVTEGTKMIITDANGVERPLNVAEACAGLKSLMTFVSLGAAIAFLSSKPLWQKLIITFSAVPIAIACNVMRVSGQGLLDRYVSHEWSTGFAHQFAGIVMLIPGFIMIMGVAWLLDILFIEEVDESETAAIPARG